MNLVTRSAKRVLTFASMTAASDGLCHDAVTCARATERCRCRRRRWWEEAVFVLFSPNAKLLATSMQLPAHLQQPSDSADDAPAVNVAVVVVVVQRPVGARWAIYARWGCWAERWPLGYHNNPECKVESPVNKSTAPPAHLATLFLRHHNFTSPTTIEYDVSSTPPAKYSPDALQKLSLSCADLYGIVGLFLAPCDGRSPACDRFLALSP